MTRLALLSLAALLAVTMSGDAPAQPAKAKVETISYAELGKRVRAEKGKVVVVYFWADY